MNRDFWIQRWKEDRIGFHLAEVNPLLQRFHDQTVTGPGRVLVPLCGKSVDLAWLVEKGHDVTGVELSPLAAQAFMEERGLNASMSSEPPFTVFRAGHIAIYVGDFFDLTPDRAGQLFDLIYDRAALIALPPETRPAYAVRLRSLLKPNGRILLVSLEYDSRAMNGPPFTVTEREVRDYFKELTVDKLLEYDCLENEPQFKERGLDWMKESVYRMRST